MATEPLLLRGASCGASCGLLLSEAAFGKHEPRPCGVRPWQPTRPPPRRPVLPVAGKELVLFLRPRFQRGLSADMEALDLQGLLPDRELARVSVLSTDSGIERDLPPGADELPAPSSPETERAGLQRKGGVKKRMWPPDISLWDGPPGLHRRTGRPSGDGELLPGVARLHTARVLVLGDDRMLGRLARAYHSLRWGPGWRGEVLGRGVLGAPVGMC